MLLKLNRDVNLAIAQEDSIEKAVDKIRKHRELLRKAVQSNKTSTQYKIDHGLAEEESVLQRFLDEFTKTLDAVEWKIMYKVQSLSVEKLLEEGIETYQGYLEIVLELKQNVLEQHKPMNNYSKVRSTELHLQTKNLRIKSTDILLNNL